MTHPRQYVEPQLQEIPPCEPMKTDLQRYEDFINSCHILEQGVFHVEDEDETDPGWSQ